MNSSSFSCGGHRAARALAGEGECRRAVVGVVDVEVVEEHAAALLVGGGADRRVEGVVHHGRGAAPGVGRSTCCEGAMTAVEVVAQLVDVDLARAGCVDASTTSSHCASAWPLGKLVLMVPVCGSLARCPALTGPQWCAVALRRGVVVEPDVAVVGGEDAPAGVGVVDDGLCSAAVLSYWSPWQAKSTMSYWLRVLALPTSVAAVGACSR